MFKLQDKQGNWRLMGVYEIFEQLVVVALSVIIAIVVVIALLQLYERVLPLIVDGGLNPLNHEVFQNLFGTIFTVLIAMEFKHSIVRAALRKDSVIQVRTVLLIAILAMSRKFVILDASTLSAATIAALSSATVALGVVYWLLRDLNKD